MGRDDAGQGPPPNAKVRWTGVVLVGLAVLGLLGAATGLDSHGKTGRIILAVVAVPLLAIGVPLLRTRMPSLDTLRADGAGLHVQVHDGPATTIPWPEIQAVWLRRIGWMLGDGGHVLGLRYRSGAPPRAVLRAFETRSDQQSRGLLIGLTHAQAEALLVDLPATAGGRYSLRV